MEMISEGKIAVEIWHLIPKQFPFAKLENFVVMPNYVHRVLVIEKINELYDKGDLSQDPDMMNTMERMVTLNPPNVGGITGNFNPMFKKNVSHVMHWYKGRCTFEVRKTNPEFGWQPKFHDHIIRNDRSYRNIAQYIIDNPKRWKEDKFFK